MSVTKHPLSTQHLVYLNGSYVGYPTEETALAAVDQTLLEGSITVYKKIDWNIVVKDTLPVPVPNPIGTLVFQDNFQYTVERNDPTAESIFQQHGWSQVKTQQSTTRNARGYIYTVDSIPGYSGPDPFPGKARMHNQRPPLNDVHVRRAISYAFDYDSFIKDVLKGRVARNAGPIPNNMWGAPQDLKGYTFDLKKAKEELQQAKVKIDRPIVINPMTGYAQTDDIALILQSGLQQIGIKANIVRETWPNLSSRGKDINTSPDIWIHWISTYYADPENWIGETYSSSRWGAWKASSWYKNPEVDELLKKARTTPDQEARRKFYEQASRIIVTGT